MSGLQDLGDAIAVIRRERDALAQRCRELEECVAVDNTNLVALLRMGHNQAVRERDALRAEVERLRQALRSVIVAAGGAAEPGVSTDFLEQAPMEVSELKRERDNLERIAIHLVENYIVDDQAYSPREIVSKAMARLKEQIK